MHHLPAVWAALCFYHAVGFTHPFTLRDSKHFLSTLDTDKKLQLTEWEELLLAYIVERGFLFVWFCFVN